MTPVSRTGLAGALVALAGLAACGGEEARPPAAAPAAVTGTALDAVLTDCELPRRRGRATGPAARLIPPAARLTSNRSTGRNDEAEAVIAQAPGAGVQTFVARARELGYTVAMSEDEGFEADAVLQGLDGVAVVKLYASARCADASRAVVILSPRR